MKRLSLTDEIWREYDVPGRDTPYRITSPLALWVGETTHRVLDSENVVHCIPWKGTILRWLPRNLENPVAF